MMLFKTSDRENKEHHLHIIWIGNCQCQNKAAVNVEMSKQDYFVGFLVFFFLKCNICFLFEQP